VWLVDLDGGLHRVERVDLPTVRELSQLTGTLDDLLADPGYGPAEDHYVAAVLTDRARPVDAMRRLQTRFPHAVHVQWERPDTASEGSYREKVRGRTDLEVASTFVSDVRSEPSEREVRWMEQALRDADRRRGVGDEQATPGDDRAEVSA